MSAEFGKNHLTGLPEKRIPAVSNADWAGCGKEGRPLTKRELRNNILTNFSKLYSEVSGKTVEPERLAIIGNRTRTMEIPDLIDLNATIITELFDRLEGSKA